MEYHVAPEHNNDNRRHLDVNTTTITGSVPVLRCRCTPIFHSIKGAQ